ncbi:MAG: hypothetical protein OXR68_05590 [Alphaproteobacteria bacterium]|nr:hypothetical protein [Alphaproteobacteria bacterium]MDD9920077.1 hypothetical protein [Alphaproteobacteria bacterium]
MTVINRTNNPELFANMQQYQGNPEHNANAGLLALHELGIDPIKMPLSDKHLNMLENIVPKALETGQVETIQQPHN